MDNGRPELSLAGISKRYGEFLALRDISLTLVPGEIAILLGANGAGKSSLMRICAGLSRADGGSVSYSGANRVPLREIGFCGHQHMLYAKLTVREQLSLHHLLRNESTNIDAAAERWGLERHIDHPIEELSKGLQYRTALCRLFASTPKYILLDEPSSALDERSVELLREALLAARASAQATILVATHDLSRLLPIADRVLLLHEGVLRFDRRRDADTAEIREEAISLYRQLNR